MKFFAGDIIPQLDAFTIEHEPIAGIDLMERTAEAMTYELESRWNRDYSILVFAGPGNNGGDALAVARLLAQDGYTVSVYLFNPLHKLSGSCALNRNRALQIENLSFFEIVSEFTPPPLSEQTLVIDGLFGTGLKRSLSGGYASLVEYINASNAPVAALDIPSGLFSEDNRENNRRYIVQADLTLSCQFPKLAFLLAENEAFVGEWLALEIGLHPQALSSTYTPFFYTQKQDVAKLYKRASRFASKRERGHLLLAAGSYGMIGAALFAAKGALHSGVGLVSLCAPACGYDILQGSVPEALFLGGAQNKTHLCQIPTPTPYQTVAIGPGLGKAEATQSAFADFLMRCRRPMVIDADGLNYVAKNTLLWEQIPKGSILTPHIREFDRLFGECGSTYERVFKAQQSAQRLSMVIVLKGAYTLVALPDGSLHFNSSGNSGMAKGGCGDLLTGILGSLLAQGYSAPQSALLGVYLHGLAGDLAADAVGEEAITPSLIAEKIGAAFISVIETSKQLPL